MPSTNITVRRAYSGCRGGFTIGSEMSGGVSNVSFVDSVSTGESGIRISSELGRGGYVRDILFKNLSFSWDKIEGKTFVVTGGASGLGEGTTRECALFASLFPGSPCSVALL